MIDCMRASSIWISLVLLGAIALAQKPPDSAIAISGIVKDPDTGRGVAGAAVTWQAGTPKAEIATFNAEDAQSGAGPNTEGVVPHYLPSKNPFVDELTMRFHIPSEATLGGAVTMYPEFRKSLKDEYTIPPPVQTPVGWAAWKDDKASSHRFMTRPFRQGEPRQCK